MDDKDLQTAAIVMASQTLIIERLAHTLDLAHGAIDMVRSSGVVKAENEEQALEAVHNVLILLPQQLDGIVEESQRLIDGLASDEAAVPVDETFGTYL